MITVHHLNNSRSQRILWLLEELSLDYELVLHQRQPTHAAPDELLSVHPLGKAPVVDVDGYVMAESGAVLEYLVHKYGAGRLAPSMDSPLYPKYLEMLHYAEGSLSLPLLDLLFDRMLQINHQQFTAYSQQRAHNQLSYVDSLLEGQDYLLGDEFSAADIQITFNLQGANASGLLANHKNISNYVARMEARAAYLAAIEKGGPFNLKFS